MSYYIGIPMSKEKKSGNTARMIYQVDATRDQILTAAQHLFIEKGLFQTQMKDVAEAGQISRASLYRYYQDKSDLALDVLTKVARRQFSIPEWERILNDSKSGLEKVEVYLRTMWLNPEKLDEYRFFAEFDAFFSGSRLPGNFLDRLREIYPSETDKHFITIIKQGQEDGSIRQDLDPHLVMVTLTNAVRGLHQRLLLRGDALLEVRSRELEQMTEELLKYCIRGISN